jgi:hypothetical protein
VKKPLTVICGSVGAPWMAADDPRSVERGGRQIQAAAEVAVERKPRLVDAGGAQAPCIAHVQIVLAPAELLAGPRQIPVPAFTVLDPDVKKYAPVSRCAVLI